MALMVLLYLVCFIYVFIFITSHLFFISALDKDSNKKVAIKKITRAFDDPVDAKRILREIKLMRVFTHENVIRIIDLVPPPPTIEEFEDIYIVQVRLT
jgi:mitogen-activated protein kinase 1/3